MTSKTGGDVDLTSVRLKYPGLAPWEIWLSEAQERMVLAVPPKHVAALQELSAGRLLLGVGIGWMEAEFRALGIKRNERGRDSDAVLAFLQKCFAADVVEANGQPFLFRPRPAKPPLLVGGRAPHALERAARYGDGWLPMGLSPSDVVAAKKQYARLTGNLGKPPGTITLMTALPLHDATQTRDPHRRDREDPSVRGLKGS